VSTVENTELVERFDQFFRKYYRDEIGQLAQRYPNEQRSLAVDWADLYRFDADLADDYVAQPDQLREYAEEALRLYDLPIDVSLGQAHVRIRNLEEITEIRAIRARDVNKLVSAQGIVRKATDVRPKVQEAAFECQRCGTLTYIPQSGAFQEPHECQGCERQGPFTINYDQSTFVDAQQIRVQERPEGLRGGETPKSLDVHIEDDITGRVAPGDHVTVTGVLRIEQQSSQNQQSRMFDVHMDGHSVVMEDEEFEDMNITDADKRDIIELSQREEELYELMVDSIAPSIYGFEDEKLAMTLQLFAGVTKHLPDETRIRGDLHILLIGDPGTGKCVSGDTKVRLGDGSEVEIRDLVEANLEDPVPVDDGVYEPVDFDVPSLGDDGSMTHKRVTKVWKREAPDHLFRITTTSGRELEVTPSHPLYVPLGSHIAPIKAEELIEGQYIATSPDAEPATENSSSIGLATDGGTGALPAADAKASPFNHHEDNHPKLPIDDIHWDLIESIELVEPEDGWVYDLEVEDTNNYLTNGVVSHNSQLLQYIRNIAPRSIYTAGKGSSSAGLCVTGDTLIHTDEGFKPIRRIAEPHHPDPVPEETSTELVTDVYSYFEQTGIVGPRSTSHVWRMPEKPCRRIETAHGKELEASVNTPVLTSGELGIEWKPISNVTPGDYVAVPRFDDVGRTTPAIEDFLELTNEKVKLDGESLSFIREELYDHFGDLRRAATELGFSENFIYLHLRNRHVPLEKLDTILDAIGADRSALGIERVMPRHGHSIRVPESFDADLMYLIGLVFGDGDIAVARRGENRGRVRLSIGDEKLLQRAAEIFKEKFDKELAIERQADRVPCIRVNSGTIARFFRNLGMRTPKEDRALAAPLTVAEHVDAFIRGYMDAEGAVSARRDGGSSVMTSTISEELARQLQLMLETYGIQAKRRTRDKRGEYQLDSGHTIVSKHLSHYVEMYGVDIDRYAEAIGFEAEEKADSLDRITGDADRNEELVPVGAALASVEGPSGGFWQNFKRAQNPGRGRARSILEELDLGDIGPAVEEPIEADLRWDEVIASEDIGEREVFDLSVPETHNFLGNGIVTHNTAAAVKDDFGDGQQWSLEAGALVLADMGIAAVDELDKMRCVTGDTVVQLDDETLPVRELAIRGRNTGSIEEHANGETIRDLDETVHTMTSDGRIVTRPVRAIHAYDAPDEVVEVTLESGERLTTTPDHPFFVIDDGDRREEPAANLSASDWVYVPRRLPKPTTDGGVAVREWGTNDHRRGSALSASHGAILGYLAGDGNVRYNREEGVYGIRFTSKEDELIAHFSSVCDQAFGSTAVVYPSERRDDGIETAHLRGKAVVDELLEAGSNLETYDGKRLPAGVTSAGRDAKAAFIRAFADSDGSVNVASRNLKLSATSYQLLLGIKELLLEFGVSAQLQSRAREDRDLHSLAITSKPSIEAYRRHIGFTLTRKEEALQSVCDRIDGDRTSIDVLPESGELFKQAREALRLHQSECGVDDATYCNFETGEANASLIRAERILNRFEDRVRQAKTDAQQLASSCRWSRLDRFRERYHVSQRTLADGLAVSQQYISDHWGEDAGLKEQVQIRLLEIVTDIEETDLEPLRRVVRSDVKWRRVAEVRRLESGQPTDDRSPIPRQRIAELLELPTVDDVEEMGRKLLRSEPEANGWDALRSELDRHAIALQRIADRIGVAGSTVSNWFTGEVDVENFRAVRSVCLNQIERKRSEIRSLLAAIEERERPKVYDLTVEGTHNYIANGMVVHNSEDRSAMHEALEQQSYHPDFELLLADGRRVNIGEFVDSKMAENSEAIVDGVDCDILPVDDVGIHTVDLDTNEVTKGPVDRVSRHEAPEEFVRVTFSNQRSVLVTPDHPMFVDRDGHIETVSAQDIEPGEFVPAPRKLPNASTPVSLEDEPHTGKEKDIQFPDGLSPKLAEILGFLIAEGHSYAGSTHEIGFSNQDDRLLARMDQLMQEVFGMTSYDDTNAVGTVTKSWISTKLYRWFRRNFPEFMHTARVKRIPAKVLGASEEEIRRFLVGAFAGDGGVESESIAFSTSSHGLAEDYADALAKIGVASRIHYNSTEDSWKTYVMGDSLERFVDRVVEPADDRHAKARAFVDRSNAVERHHDVLPVNAAAEIRALRRLAGLSLTGEFRKNLDEQYGVRIETVERHIAELRERIQTIRTGLSAATTLAEIRETAGWSCRQLADRVIGFTSSSVNYAEHGGYDAGTREEMAGSARNAVLKAAAEVEHQLDTLEERTSFRFYRVKDVETVPNDGERACDWVYDVTVEPTNTFVSKGVVLHNSISISKAGINATLKARCALLGAANPKYGRFDQYEPVAEQIDLEPALISRFDLIFTVTDAPDEERDAELADHILETNYAGELQTQMDQLASPTVTVEDVDSAADSVMPAIEPELFRKYIAYAKRNVYPSMTDEARQRIRDFYVDLRAQGTDEDSPVPITARKLEALVRLAEASARVRLSDTVEVQDAERVVDIVRGSLQDIGVDPETGQFDADVIETGTSKTQRDRIKSIRSLIKEIETEYEDGAPVDEVLSRAGEAGIDESKVEHEIEKLRQRGEVYEPATGHLRTT